MTYNFNEKPTKCSMIYIFYIFIFFALYTYERDNEFLISNNKAKRVYDGRWLIANDEPITLQFPNDNGFLLPFISRSRYYLANKNEFFVYFLRHLYTIYLLWLFMILEAELNCDIVMIIGLKNQNLWHGLLIRGLIVFDGCSESRNCLVLITDNNIW